MSCGLSYTDFITLLYVPSVPSLMRIFIMSGFEFFQMPLLHLLRWPCDFFVCLVYHTSVLHIASYSPCFDRCHYCAPIWSKSKLSHCTRLPPVCLGVHCSAFRVSPSGHCLGFSIISCRGWRGGHQPASPRQTLLSHSVLSVLAAESSDADLAALLPH